MELTLHRQPLTVRETVAEESWEQPVECDALLPDDCPDIARVLHCGMTPRVYANRLSGQRLDTDGMTELTVCYQTPQGGMARCVYRVPFSHVLELRQEAPGAAVQVTAEAGYCNCRAVNQRRLDIRGAAAFSASVCCDRDIQTVCGGEGPGLELRQEPVGYLRTVGSGTREVAVSEQADLGAALPERFLRAQATADLAECRVVSGKALVKGELHATLVWAQPDGGWQRKHFTLPYATVVELPGAAEGMECMVRQRVLEFTPETTLPDGTAGLLLTATVLVEATAYAQESAPCACDAYSTKHPCACHSVTAAPTVLAARVDETVQRREELPLPEGMAELLDLWGEVQGDRLTLCMVVRMNDGELAYIEKTFPLILETPPEGEAMLAWTLLDTDYAMLSEQSAEARCRLRATGAVFGRRKVSVIDEITVDESRQKENAVKPGLYICMAAGDEAMWDVAKRYNTSVARIAEENAGGNVLLIPVI